MRTIKRAMTSPVITTLGGASAGAAGGYIWDRIDEWLNGGKIKSKRRPIALGIIGALPGIIQGIGQTAYTNGPYEPKDVLNPDEGVKSDRDVPWYYGWIYNPHDLAEKSENFRHNMEKRNALERNALERNPSAPDLINTDIFGNIIWEDPNTHFSAANAVTGVLESTKERTGSSFVTPGQITKSLVDSGIGAVTGWTIAHTLGAMAGLSPQTQKTIQDIGMWGGLMNGIGNQIR